MNESAAIQLLNQLTSDEEREAVAARLPLDLLEMVLAAQSRIQAGEEPADGEAEALKLALTRIVFELEVIERDLIRFLKFESETARTWQQVADEFGEQYDTRQAIQKRWSRLTALDRRVTTRDMRRGAAAKSRHVVDTTTVKE